MVKSQHPSYQVISTIYRVPIYNSIYNDHSGIKHYKSMVIFEGFPLHKSVILRETKPYKSVVILLMDKILHHQGWWLFHYL